MLALQCRLCHEINREDEQVCDVCGFDLDDAKTILDANGDALTYNEAMAQDLGVDAPLDISVAGPAALATLARHWRACCDRAITSCDCEAPVSFASADEAASAAQLRPYDASCSDCALQYSAACEVYRSELHAWVLDRNHSIKTISRCADYTEE